MASRNQLNESLLPTPPDFHALDDGGEQGHATSTLKGCGLWADPRKRPLIVVAAAVVILLLLIAAIAVAVSSPSSPDTPPEPIDLSPWSNRRLPTYVQPALYHIVEYVDLDSTPPVHWGSTTVTLAVTRPTLHLIIHVGSNLVLTNVSMTGDDGQPIAIAAWWRFLPYDYLILNFTAPLQPQRAAELGVGFYGNLIGAPYTGMYLAYYTNSTGRTVNMASTQFSPTDARRAFPCFDEPAIKARYLITIHNSERYPTVLSNMRPSMTSPSPGRPAG